MKSFIQRFVTDQSGAVSFEDGLTIFSLTVGFIAAVVLLNKTFVELYVTIFGMLPGNQTDLGRREAAGFDHLAHDLCLITFI
jgi:Flp pilus assembly pilin Flp